MIWISPTKNSLYSLQRYKIILTNTYFIRKYFKFRLYKIPSHHDKTWHTKHHQHYLRFHNTLSSPSYGKMIVMKICYIVDYYILLRYKRQGAALSLGSGLLADVSQDTAIHIEHVTVDSIRSMRSEEDGRTA